MGDAGERVALRLGEGGKEIEAALQPSHGADEGGETGGDRLVGGGGEDQSSGLKHVDFGDLVFVHNRWGLGENGWGEGENRSGDAENGFGDAKNGFGHAENEMGLAQNDFGGVKNERGESQNDSGEAKNNFERKKTTR